VADYFQIAPATLCDPSKERHIVRAKAVICYAAVRKSGIKGGDVATRLGYSSTAVTHAAKRGQKLLRDDGELQQLLEGLAKL
jgi:chromosomal replication initiation ATPase DnaA